MTPCIFWWSSIIAKRTSTKPKCMAPCRSKLCPMTRTAFGGNLHYVQDDSNGQRKPERKSFYDAVAKTLHDAKEILLFGHGTGASSAMEQLLAELKQHHSDLAKRVVGSVVVDDQHLTENQLLAKAREFYEEKASPKQPA